MTNAPLLSLGLRKVVVTGGGSGIGRAIAQAIVARGGEVAVVGRRPEPLAEFVAANPGKSVALPCDLNDDKDRATILARAKAALGGLDGVVHSAGVVKRERFGQISEQALREQLEIHVVAAVRVCEQAIGALTEGGSILIVSSTLGHRPTSYTLTYSMAKAAQH